MKRKEKENEKGKEKEKDLADWTPSNPPVVGLSSHELRLL